MSENIYSQQGWEKMENKKKLTFCCYLSPFSFPASSSLSSSSPLSYFDKLFILEKFLDYWKVMELVQRLPLQHLPMFPNNNIFDTLSKLRNQPWYINIKTIQISLVFPLMFFFFFLLWHPIQNTTLPLVIMYS